jgi:hypothetical protein
MTHLTTIAENHQRTIFDLSLSEEELKLYNEQGFLGPYNLFDAEEAKNIFDRCFRYPRLLLPWKKGRHGVVKELAKTAMNPRIVNRVSSILGDDVLLWGSILIRQPASGKHPMHVDVEHAEWEGVSIWIAMQNVISGSSFSVVSGSHLFDTSPQELQQSQGLNCSDDEAVLEAAKKLNPASRLVYLDVKDGQFIIFSGKLWHATKNTTKELRGSIVLQYTTPDNKVKIPKTYTMPKGTWSKKPPLCLLVKGKDDYKVNKYIDYSQINGKSNLVKALFYYFPSNVMENLKRRM